MAYFAGGFICRLHSSRKGQPVQLPPKTDSFKQYAERLSEYAKSDKLMREEEYWRFIEEETAAELPHEKPQASDGSRQHSANGKLYAYRRRNVRFASAGKPGLPYRYARYSSDCRGFGFTGLDRGGRLRIAMEGHGREHIMPELDISRTVGWFTSMYPVLIDLNTAGAELGTAVKTVKDTLGRIPDKGIGYGILKYMTPPEQKTIRFRQAPEISFNYLGQFNDTEDQHTFSLSGLASGHDITPTWRLGTSGGNERDGRTKQTSLQFELSAEPLPQRNDGTVAANFTAIFA